MMTFERTGNIALHVADFEGAVSFYRDTLKLPVKEFNAGEMLFEMKSGLFYVSENPDWQGLVEEYAVDNLDAARSLLEAVGCTVIRWEGRGRDCYMRDPFGMYFNLWERVAAE